MIASQIVVYRQNSINLQKLFRLSTGFEELMSN
jgi:hypothetical protein